MRRSVGSKFKSEALLVTQPVPAVPLLWAVWLLGRGCGLDCGYGCRSAARTPTEKPQKNKKQTTNSVSGSAAIDPRVCGVGGVTYLPGFVRVFHSGRLLYVDFCRVHTSRLFRERGGEQNITSRSAPKSNDHQQLRLLFFRAAQFRQRYEFELIEFSARGTCEAIVRRLPDNVTDAG